MFFLKVYLILFVQLAQSQELGGGSGGFNKETRGTSFEQVPQALQAPNYNQCSDSEKKQRINLHNKCLNNFSEMGLAEIPKPSDLVQKFSCSSIESSLKDLRSGTIGCVKYLINEPVETIKSVGAVLGIGKYDDLIKGKCGKAPRPSQEALTLSPYIPSEQKKLSELSQKFAERRAVYDKCKDTVVTKFKAKVKNENKAYDASMLKLTNYCIEKNPVLTRYRNQDPSSRVSGKYGQRLKQLNQCRLDAMEILDIDCSRCIEAMTPEGIEPGNSKSFKDLYVELKKRYQCFNSKKIGEIACGILYNAASIASGAGGVSLAATKALGRDAATKLSKKTAQAIKRSQRNADSTNLQATQAVQAAKRKTDALDNLENRAELAQAVLQKQGLPSNLNQTKKRALWKAHTLPDNQIAQKARILAKAGFNKKQRDALVRGSSDLNGKGVAGGYNNPDFRKRDFEENRDKPDFARLSAEVVESNNRGQITGEVIDLRRAEVENLRRHWDSAGATAPSRNRDPLDVSDAYSDYAGVVKDSNQTAYEKAVNEAVKFREIYVKSDTYKKELKSAGLNPNDLTNLAQYNFAQYQRLQKGLAGKNEATRARLRAKMEVLRRQAQKNGWKMDGY